MSEPGADPDHPLSAEKGSLAELMRVAGPLIISSGSLSLLHVMDRTFLTWFSQDAVAAALPSGLMIWTFLGLVIGTVGYVNTFVAQYDGAGRQDRVSQAVWQGIYLACGFGVLFVAAIPYAQNLFDMVGHEPSVRAMEVTYFRIGCWGALPVALNAALACFFSGRGVTWPVMVVNLGLVAINGALDYVLIFGKLGFEPMGIAGAAWGTVIANVCGVIAYLALIGLPVNRKFRFYSQWQLQPQLLRRVLRYGLPTGLQYLVDIAAFSVFVFVVGNIGKRELTATNLAFNLNTLAFAPLMGFGTAVSTLVGKRIGEGTPQLAVKTTYLACYTALLYSGLFAFVYLVMPDLLLWIYRVKAGPEFEQTADLIKVLLRFVAVFGLFDALAIVFGSAIRGAGDTRFCTVATLICGWGCMGIPCAISWTYFGGNLWVSWTACTMFITTLGITFFLRFRGNRWQSMRVIESRTDLLPEDDLHADAHIDTRRGAIAAATTDSAGSLPMKVGVTIDDDT